MFPRIATCSPFLRRENPKRTSIRDLNCGPRYETQNRSPYHFDRRRLPDPPGFLELEEGGTSRFRFSPGRACVPGGLLNSLFSTYGSAGGIRLGAPPRTDPGEGGG